MTDIALPATPAGAVRRRRSRDDAVMAAGLVLLALWLAATVALPLWSLLSKSVEDRSGGFVGLANFATYFASPALSSSLWNSLFVALLSAAVVTPLAFGYAYALTRSCMRAKPLFRLLALVPVLAPSLLPGISFV